MDIADHATFEIAGAKPRLRDGLVFTFREIGGEPGVIIEDELSGRFFRVGMSEYVFLSQLDGRTSIGDALGATALQLKDRALTEDDAASLCQWVIESGVAVIGNESVTRQEQEHQRQVASRLIRWINPLMLRMPLFSPERFLRGLQPLLGWLISGTGAVIWCLLCGVAVLRIVPEWESVQAGMRPLLEVDNRWKLALTWLLIKFVHEGAHGLVCQRLGGIVRECGVNWLLFVPLPYVDVTSCWRFASTSQRMLVSAAGMLAEVALAAVAAIVWTLTDSVVVRQHATNVMISATVTTLLFNANPLMRSDGYYLLSDLLDCPNLASQGRQFVRNLFRVFFQGLRSHPLDVSTGRWLLIGCYGILSTIWSSLIGVGLVIGAANLGRGVGVVLACGLILMWYAWPILVWVRGWVRRDHFESPRFLHMAGALCLCGGCLGVGGTMLPAPAVVSAPVVVQSRPLTVVHTLVTARVQRVVVGVGEEVEAGDLLVDLQNNDLQADLEQLRAEIRTSAQREILFLSRGEVAAAEVEHANRHSLDLRQNELTRLVESLQVRAPSAGRVLTRRLEELVGRELPAGSELMRIASVRQPEMVALVPQSEVASIRGREGQAVTGWLWGHSRWIHGTIASIDVSATQSTPHPALTAEAGGPLPVMARDPLQTESSMAKDSKWQLIEPQIEVTIRPATDSPPLAIGETGIVRLPIRRGTLGGYVASCVEGWFSSRWAVMHGL